MELVSFSLTKSYIEFFFSFLALKFRIYNFLVII